MKKDRNCANNMYPTYPNMMPMPMPMMGMMQSPMVGSNMVNNQQYDSLESINNRLTSLERRVSKLENTTPQVTPLNSYSDTNFYMM